MKMDEINAFFSMSSAFKRETVCSGSVNGRVIPKVEPTKFAKREFHGTDYGDDFRQARMEENKMFDDYEDTPEPKFKHKPAVDDIESDNVSMKTEGRDRVYDLYDFKRTLPDLPICGMKDTILNAIEKNRVIILEGATGCGKTTQVPQFILDDAYETNRCVNIVVTQPRRIAAVSIANRVAFERRLPKQLPHLIGYQIGLQVRTNDDTRITYCTTGVLLEILVATKSMSNYTHIILDEVHERSQNMDFLFIVIKQLRRTAPNVKIILMSATIEAVDFANYFKCHRRGSVDEQELAPIIKVDRKSNHKISKFYLDDLAKLKVDINQPFNIANPQIEEDMYTSAVKLILILNRIDMSDEPTHVKPTVLIFLPGIYEISCMNQHIEKCANNMSLQNEFIVVLLHSMITHDEQVKALRKPSPGKRIIILATNIAESSITVPDVKYVIDFCLTKNNVTDTTTNFTSLQLEWASRSNCRQRAGRTGRTMDGRVYRLVPRDFYEKHMDESSRPEMLRSPLENVVLKAKQLDMGTPTQILSLAMDRPTLYDIQNTILLLKETGAMLKTVDDKYSDDDGDLTFIGHVMAALPVNIHVAKLIVLGYCYSVLPECIIIAAGLTTKSIFVQGMKNVVSYYSKKLVWSDGSGSDLFAILKAYKAYEDRVKNVVLNSKTWADRYFLNEKSLSEMSILIGELTLRLERLGIKERIGVNRAKWNPAEKLIILKVVIAGAFYPNYFVRTSNEMGDRSTSRAINGRNPCNTVFFSGFPEKYIRPLYVESIKKVLMQCTNSPDNIQVSFDEGNEKIYVSFKQTVSSLEANSDPELNCVQVGPGQVCIEVYKALKLRKSSKPIILKVMHPKDAQLYAEQMKIGALVKGKWECEKKSIKNIHMVCLPRRHIKSVTGTITYYDTSFNRFWFRPIDEETLFNDIQSELNSLNRDIEPFSGYGDVHVGQVVAASYDGTYYRAKILSSNEGPTKVYYNVQLMDVGLEGDVEFGDLRRLRGVSIKFIDIPPRLFECRLACLQPSELHSARYGWESTMKKFKELTTSDTLTAEIYSVENGVASVFIYVNDRTVQAILIEEKFACTAEENYMSKVDHNDRLQSQAMPNNRFEEECDVVADEMRRMMPFEEQCEVQEPDLSMRHIPVTLNGPKSPLETNIHSSLYGAKTKKIGIEPQSVNSILLEANPQDTFEKYIIAANVTEGQSRIELSARETSIMPNIPGFGPLMALIFAPYCEFFRDKYKSRYVAILCGLGEDPKRKQPMYCEHDALFNLDAEIDVEDIENINTIRFIMDSLLQMRPDHKHPSATEHEQNSLTVQLKDAIIKLLEKPRSLQGVPYDFDIGWSKFNPKDVIKAKNVFSTAIYPFHDILALAAADSPERLDQIHTLIENNKELHAKSRTDMSLRRPIKCLLCHMDLENVPELKIHLHSRLHTDREKKISLEF